MSNGWDFGDDVEEVEQDEQEDPEPEEEEPEEQEPGEPKTVEDAFRQAVEAGEVEDEYTTVELNDVVDEVYDTDLLEQASEIDDRKTAVQYYDRRVSAIKEAKSSFPDSPDDVSEDQSSLEDMEEDDSGVEEIEDVQEDDSGDDAEDDVEELDVPQEASGGVQEIDVDSSAMTATEAAEKEHKWRMMVWGPPGLFKTHFAFTMPEPVCLIDTEGKASDIAHKFTDRVTYIFEPEGYEDARQMLGESIDILDRYQEEQGVTGTIVVDSMSMMWEWAQQHYVDRWYPQADSLSDAREEFQSAISSGGAGDWKKIKEIHNEKFRRVMLLTDYHLCWTATPTEDYDAVIRGEAEGTPMKPAGEKNNVHKVNHIIRGRRDDDGRPVGDLEKSGLTKTHYRGLPYPTFSKHEHVIEEIKQMEMEGEQLPAMEMDGEVIDLIEGVSPRGG